MCKSKTTKHNVVPSPTNSILRQTEDVDVKPAKKLRVRISTKLKNLFVKKI